MKKKTFRLSPEVVRLRKRIRAYQERTGISDREFARKARMGPTVLHKILRDRNPLITPKSKRKIEKVLDPTTDDPRFIAMGMVMHLKRRHYSNSEIAKIRDEIVDLTRTYV